MSDKTYTVKADEFEFSFSQEEIEQADIIPTQSGHFHVISNNRSITVRIIDDEDPKSFRVEVEGDSFHIQVKDELDQVLDTLGFNNVAVKQIKEIKAPMPGMVLDVAVVPGQEVVAGDRILILEAMKMENSILMHASGVIRQVLVKKGQPVDKGQVLVELM
jgi:biotin carboxyl carrier protein